MIELQFPVQGQSLPVDHGYLLYSALSGMLPLLHGDGEQIAVGPISGQWTGNGALALSSRRSRRRRGGDRDFSGRRKGQTTRSDLRNCVGCDLAVA